MPVTHAVQLPGRRVTERLPSLNFECIVPRLRPYRDSIRLFVGSQQGEHFEVLLVVLADVSPMIMWAQSMRVTAKNTLFLHASFVERSCISSKHVRLVRAERHRNICVLRRPRIQAVLVFLPRGTRPSITRFVHAFGLEYLLARPWPVSS